MNEEFVDLRREHLNSESFWPAFTDIMMVVVIIFLLTSMLLMIKNWELLKQLRSSLEAEQQAEKIIQDTSLEKATLEEQLAMAQNEISTLRLQLLQASEQANQLNLTVEDKDKQIVALLLDNTELKNVLTKNENQISLLNLQLSTTRENLQQLNIDSEKQISSLNLQLLSVQENFAQQKKDSKNQISKLNTQLMITQESLKQLNIDSEDQISSLNTQLIVTRETLEQLKIDTQKKDTVLTEERQKLIILTQQRDSQSQKLSSLEQDFGSLQVKYDKLFKPARTAKGKHMVSVSLKRINGKERIRFKDAGDKNFTLINKQQLHSKLSKLQNKHKNDLYLRIVIPEDSGLTYNEAWAFMKETLHKYDYYYQ